MNSPGAPAQVSKFKRRLRYASMIRRSQFRLLLALTTMPMCNLAAKNGNPCIVYESSPYGFGSNILGLLLTIAAHNESTQIYFDESTWKYKCNGTSGWSHLFSGLTPLPLQNGETSPQGCLRAQYEGSEVSGHDMLKEEDPLKVFNKLRHSTQQVWQLSRYMRQKVDSQAAYLRSLRKPLIGVVIRAGDKTFEDRLWGNRPTDWYQERTWAAKLKNLLQQNGFQPGGTCIIFSDDLTAMHEGSKVLRAELNCMTIQIGGWEGGFHRDAWVGNAMSQSDNASTIAEEYCNATIDLIMELEALSIADVFTGSYNSNLARLVHLLRFHVHGKPKQSAQDVLDSIDWHHDYRFYSSIAAQRV